MEGDKDQIAAQAGHLGCLLNKYPCGGPASPQVTCLVSLGLMVELTGQVRLSRKLALILFGYKIGMKHAKSIQ